MLGDHNDDSPPKAPPIQYNAPLGTRWAKEKAAAGGAAAFDLPTDPKCIGPWILGECIGKGASGRVKVARHRRTRQLAAVKILPVAPLVNSRASLATQQAKSEKQRLGIDREITMMKLMNHPNIMRIYDVYEGEKELFLVLEYVEGGELFDFLVNRGRLPPSEAQVYFRQIIYGLNYAHTFSIIHRDLKPENILIASLDPPVIKIADWGMAAFAPPSLQLETSCGSPHYASPEIVNGEKYFGTATDIWSCGVILFALLTGRLPFDDKNVRTLLSKVKSGKYDMPAWIDPLAKDLLTKMLVVDVKKRITIPEILSHPWFKKPLQSASQSYSILDNPVLPPSPSTLGRPIPSAAMIDPELFSSLRVIWGRHAEAHSASIQRDLCSPAGQGTYAKAFYFLLNKYREETMRSRLDDGTHPAHHSAHHRTIHSESDAIMESTATSHTRRLSEGMYPRGLGVSRSPVPVSSAGLGPAPPEATSPVSPVLQVAAIDTSGTAGGTGRPTYAPQGPSRHSVGVPVSTNQRILPMKKGYYPNPASYQSQQYHHHPHPYHQQHASESGRLTSPVAFYQPAGVAMGASTQPRSPAPDHQQATSLFTPGAPEIVIGKPSVLVSTPVQGEACDTSNVTGYPSSPAHPYSNYKQTDSASAAPPTLAPVSFRPINLEYQYQVPLSPTTPTAATTAPTALRVLNPTGDVAERVPSDDIMQAAALGRSDTIMQSMMMVAMGGTRARDSTTVGNTEPLNASVAASAPAPASSAAGTGARHTTRHSIAVADKENMSNDGWTHVDPSQVRGYRASRTSREMGKDLGNRSSTSFIPVTSLKGKKEKERKGRPPPLELMNSSQNRRNLVGSPIPHLTSPVIQNPPTSSRIMASPVVGEFRGWFSNLFNWKPGGSVSQPSIFYSMENGPHTRDLAFALFQSMGYMISRTTPGSVGPGTPAPGTATFTTGADSQPAMGNFDNTHCVEVYQCRLDQFVSDPRTGLVLKPGRFRVEFCFVSPQTLSTTGPGTAGFPSPNPTSISSPPGIYPHSPGVTTATILTPTPDASNFYLPVATPTAVHTNSLSTPTPTTATGFNYFRSPRHSLSMLAGNGGVGGGGHRSVSTPTSAASAGQWDGPPGCSCVITLAHEKGSTSTFKAVRERLKDAFDAQGVGLSSCFSPVMPATPYPEASLVSTRMG